MAKATKEDTRERINNERKSMSAPEMEALLSSMLPDISIKRLVCEMLVGGIWGFTIGTIGASIINALVLVSMPAWVQFVATMLVVVAALVFVFLTSQIVATNVCDAGEHALGHAKKLFAKAKAKYNAFEMPSFASHTTH